MIISDEAGNLVNVTPAGRLTVDAVVSGSGGSVDQGSANGDPAQAWTFRASDGAVFYVIATEATLATRASEATLATRASEATLATRAASSQLPATLGPAASAGSLSIVPGTGVTVAVSAVSLPLPTGAATQATLATLALAAQLPATLGAKTSALSLSVVPATDATTVTNSNPSSTGTRTVTTVTTTEGQLVAANTSRRGGVVANDGGNAVFIGLGGTVVTTTNYTFQLAANTSRDIPSNFQGSIRAVRNSGTGGVIVTELT